MISDEVKLMEERLFAYQKVSSLIKKNELLPRGFSMFSEEDFSSLKKYFQVLGLNRSYSYCPFPYDCNCYAECTEKQCNADTCSNGYAHRW